MDWTYEVFLEKGIYEGVRNREERLRFELVALLDRLSANPFFEVDDTFTDHKGRPVHKAIVGNFLITFSVDHPAKEVKIHELLVLSD